MFFINIKQYNNDNASLKSILSEAYGFWYGVLYNANENENKQRVIYVANPISHKNPISAEIRRAESPGHKTYTNPQIYNLTETGCYIVISDSSSVAWSIVIVRFRY